ncbi:MAG TPA: metallophosphoesterase, partial [Thermoanaerobaculia bacterium]|nr:metallophosphoesterase [Thermoanaerobaculia bacterium]
GLFSAVDPLFDRLFRDVYTEKTFSFPFFPVLGNHEYHRNAGAVPRLGSRDARWRMPARRYAFVEPLAEGKNAVFVALDTTAFDSPARVTPSRDVRPPLEGVAEELAGTPATVWRFVIGHHPPATSGAHGSSEGVLKTLCPVLAAARVDLYITGHDHILESLAPIAGVPVVVSGGGAGWDRATPIVRVRPESEFRHTGGGFVRAEVTVEKATFTFYDVDGRSLYVRTLHPNPPAPGTTPLPAKP